MVDVPLSPRWVRVTLAAPAAGELVVRADSMLTQSEHVVFLLGNMEVFRLERRFYAASMWFVARPSLRDRLLRRGGAR